MIKIYDIIYTDPPWQQQKGNKRKCRPNQNKNLDYLTLSIDEVFEIQKPFFDDTNTKHNIFMWTIDKFLHQTEQEMQKLGYTLHARFIWDKTNGVAPAFTIRFSHEYLLWFYKKGNMLMPCEEQRGKYMTVFKEAATVHSKKPICVYEMIESMFPTANKIELFARNTRNGWESWGNEIINNIEN